MLDDPTMRYNSKWSTLYLLFHYVFPFNYMGMWWSYNGRWIIMIHLMLVFNMFSLCSLFLSLCISFNCVVVCDGDYMWGFYNGKWLIVIHFYVLSLCCLLLSLFFYCFHYVVVAFTIDLFAFTMSFHSLYVCVNENDMWGSYNGKWLMVIHFYELSLCGYVFPIMSFTLTLWLCE